MARVSPKAAAARRQNAATARAARARMHDAAASSPAGVVVRVTPSVERTSPLMVRTTQASPSAGSRYVAAIHAPHTTPTDIAVASSPSLPRRHGRVTWQTDALRPQDAVVGTGTSSSLPRRQGHAAFMTNPQRIHRMLAAMRQRAHDNNVEHGIANPPPAYRRQATQQERDMMRRYIAAKRTRDAARNSMPAPTTRIADQERARRQLQLAALRLRTQINRAKQMIARLPAHEAQSKRPLMRAMLQRLRQVMAQLSGSAREQNMPSRTPTTVAHQHLSTPAAPVLTPNAMQAQAPAPQTVNNSSHTIVTQNGVRWHKTVKTQRHPSRPRAFTRTTIVRCADDDTIAAPAVNWDREAQTLTSFKTAGNGIVWRSSSRTARLSGTNGGTVRQEIIEPVRRRSTGGS
ncbi:hypothetical protein OHC33_007793 [Knufia fluminis]|uniref:Uncharacterized protein n=1 Tax=Knufia fluminis TaxID=191047 RepID=A0AAN8ECQ4_9EURO|nr:hypothetical protein OHC33_007793 [Knufia fluminis]